jgi:hypothetical protein
MKRQAWLGFGLIWAGIGLVVPAVAANPTTPPPVSTRQQERALAWADARILFAVSSYGEAEQVLCSVNTAVTGSGAWHLESAQALVGMAYSFRDRRDYARGLQIAKLALTHLRVAETALPLSGPGKTVARAKELQGRIAGEFLGDWAGALQYYRAALQLDPKSSQAATEVLRLEAIQAAVNRKTK